MPALAAALAVLSVLAAQDPSRLARDYVDAVRAVNEAHLKKPLGKTEAELAAKLPASADQAVAGLAKAPDAPAVREALVAAARAALDLDRGKDFAVLRDRLAALDAEAARELGILVSRPRFLAIGTNGIEPACLAAIADVFDLVLDAYRDVFHLEQFSKVPGKKLRLLVHLEAAITRPPHFAPEFPWHSQIDFPVIDATAFTSPTKDGKFLFYGLCHELGHVIAMWGDTKNEEDRHAWAHYTGVVVVEHVAKTKKDVPAIAALRDVRWRSLDFEQKRLAAAKTAPGGKDTDAVLARFLALHAAVGSKAIGDALDELDRKDQNLRVNRVRYYTMRDFQKALLAGKPGQANKKAVEAAFRD